MGFIQVEVKKMIFDLADFENSYYVQGGHSQIRNIQFEVTEDNSLNVSFLQLSDYDRDPIEVKATISQCE